MSLIIARMASRIVIQKRDETTQDVVVEIQITEDELKDMIRENLLYLGNFAYLSDEGEGWLKANV